MNKKILILIPLVLSGFTHLWNPVGFPDIFFDEGVYMRRAVNLLETGNPQESYLYDHPYFGQIVLAGILKTTSYPDIINLDGSSQSVSELYLVPRLFMGLLAVLDTFLLYKIAEKRFDTRIAFLAALLFAVMPFTWVLRRILLDSLLLPFLLSSILVALHVSDSKNKTLLVATSGVLLGLAIFTKIPAVTMIPLVAYLALRNNASAKTLSLFVLPVVLIPMIWVGYSIHLEEFGLLQKDVLWQTNRSNSIGVMFERIWFIDPLLIVLSLVGVTWAAVRREKMILLWFFPLIVFFLFVGYKQYFHWIPVFPVMCLAVSVLLNNLATKIPKAGIYKICLAFGIFGIISTGMLVIHDVSESQFDAAEYVLNKGINNDTTVLASPVYSWVFQLYGMQNVPIDYSYALFFPIATDDVLLVAGEHFDQDIQRGEQLRNIYESTTNIQVFEGNVAHIDKDNYPYSSMWMTLGGDRIDIRQGNVGKTRG